MRSTSRRSAGTRISLLDAAGPGSFGAVFQSLTPGLDIFVERSMYWGTNLEGSSGRDRQQAAQHTFGTSPRARAVGSTSRTTTCSSTPRRRPRRCRAISIGPTATSSRGRIRLARSSASRVTPTKSPSLPAVDFTATFVGRRRLHGRALHVLGSRMDREARRQRAPPADRTSGCSRRAPHRRASRPSIWSSIRTPHAVTVQATFFSRGWFAHRSRTTWSGRSLARLST